MEHRNSLILATVLVVAATSLAGTWLAGPGKGSHAAAGSAVTFKSVLEETINPTGLTWTLTGTANVAAGDLVVIGYAGSILPTSITVGANAATLIQSNTAEGYIVSMWYVANASANAAAAILVDVNGSNFNIATVAVYSGIATASALDQSSCNSVGCASQTDSATTHTAQNVTTTNANDLLVAFDVDWDNKTSHTAGTNWTKRTAAGTKNSALLDRTVSSTGSYPNATVVTVDDTGDDGYYMIFAAFKAL